MSKGGTGQGATLTLSVSGAVGRVRAIQLPTWAMEKIDMTALDSVDFMSYTPGDVTDPGDMTIEAVFDSEEDMPTLGVVETATVTFPLMVDTNDIKAEYSGTGFLTEATQPNLTTNELMVLNLTFSFDGGTGPAFTSEALTPP